MKIKLPILLFFLLISIISYTQHLPSRAGRFAMSKNKVPLEIKKKFKQEFSTVKTVKWLLIKLDNIYVANFQLNKQNTYVEYNKENQWLRTTTYITYTKIPEKVKDSVDQYFHDRGKIIGKVQDAEKGIYYEVSTMNTEGYESFTILFSEDGEMLERHSAGIATH